MYNNFTMTAKSFIGDINSPFIAFNPYRAAFLSKAAETLTPTLIHKEDEVPGLADRVVNWGRDILFHDYEKAIDFTGKTANFLDWGATAIFAGMEGTIIFDQFFNLSWKTRNHFIGFLPTLLKVSFLPLTIVFAALGGVEWIAEFVNMRRSALLLHHMSKKKTPLKNLKWLQKTYYTLEDTEVEKIYGHIEKHLPQFTLKEKASRFDQIAEKALKIKYAALKRRITTKLGDAVTSQMKEIMADLNDKNPLTRESAEERAEVLMKSISRPVRNKIVVHILGLIAISFTLISLFGYFAGITAPAFLFVLGSFAVAFLVMQFLVKRGTLNREVEKLYVRLEKVNLRAKVA